MVAKKRKPIDPFFQQLNYFVVMDETGVTAGMVYVLDTAMMPVKHRGGKRNDSVYGLRRTGRPGPA
jgi:hypothetical protein